MNLRLITRIARTELATLFYSPVAWLLLLAFACQVGIDFGYIINEIAKIKVMGRDITFSITAGVTLGSYGLYEAIQDTIYLYIPLLTMNLMSREYASGSIKLLYSSPLSSGHIIFGKFLSMVVFALIFVVILALPMVAVAVTTPMIDIPLILSGLLSMFLLILTYCAVGLFMSTLTSYQIVAAVATLSTLTFLNFIGKIGQSSPFLREITYWLSLKGRASEMVSGLICSDDVIYFITVIAMFLAFSIIVLSNEKTRRSFVNKSLRYVAVLACVVVVGYVSSRPALMSFYDATYSDQNTLSKESQEVMAQLDGPMTITTYVDIFDSEFDYASPQAQMGDKDRFKKYTRFKPEIKMEYVYYYTTPTDSAFYAKYPGKTIEEIAAEVAKKKKLNPKRLVSAESLKEEIDLSEENYRFVRVVERGSGEKARLRLFDDMFVHPNEAEISAAMKKMLVEPVKVGSLIGHGERSIKRGGDRDYSFFATRGRFRNSMINQGFDVLEVNLAEQKDVPEEINILIIPEMRQPMTDEELSAVDRFIERGGNLVVLADVGRQKAMNPLLERLGVRMLEGQIAQPSAINPYNLVLSRATQIAADSLKGRYRTMRANTNYQAITMPGAVGLEVVDTTKFQPWVILCTDTLSTWIEHKTTDFIDETPTCDERSGEKVGSFITGLALRRMHNDKQQRIFVFGDADCWSNAEVLASRAGISANNFSIIPNAFRWLCYGEFPVSSARTPHRDTDTSLTPMMIPRIKNTYCIAIPLVIGLIGVFVIMRRRRG